ncbi:MAG TPA: hypothetical protein VER36_02950 [Flavisolibacter sp.]|nr:hypothetical protein [Flavisolibacter sp.]
MKKIVIFSLIACGAIFQFCSSTKQAQATVQKVTYAADIQPLIQNSCAPCHIPPKGNKEALHTFETAKANIDESIKRIKLNPGDKGFMPFKHPKMSDSAINVFVKWKEDGLLEK